MKYIGMYFVGGMELATLQAGGTVPKAPNRYLVLLLFLLLCQARPQPSAANHAILSPLSASLHRNMPKS